MNCVRRFLRVVKWSYALLLSIPMLCIALATRGVHPSLGPIAGGLVTVLLVIGFPEVSGSHLISGCGDKH